MQLSLNRNAVVVLAILLLSSSAVYAGQASGSLVFHTPMIEKVDGFDRITLPEALNLGNPGEPSLPSAGVWLLLAPGERAVSAVLVDEKWVKLEGEFTPEPVYPQYRLSDPNPVLQVDPIAGIYNSNVSFPETSVDNLSTNLKRGFALATCLVHPVRWNPVDRSIEYLTSANIIVITESGVNETGSFNRFYQGDLKTRQWVQERVSNPDQLLTYPRRDDEGEPETMLVVAFDDIMDGAMEYAAWRTKRGMRTYVATVDALREGQDGEDEQEELRSGIIEAYEELGIDYLLLMGDDGHIPHRGLWATVNDSPDNDIPADIYYAGLDGDWNADGDGNYGEANDSPDITAELLVGRFPAENEEELQRIMHKVILYTDEPVIDNTLMILMVGEDLSWNVWGGEYMDEIYEGSNNYGFSTEGYPERFDRMDLYEMNGVWSFRGHLAPLISDGYHMINHLGHAFTNQCFKTNLNELSDQLVTNNGEDNGFNIAFSQGCYAGAFDNREDQPGHYADDNIGVKFITGLDNGYVAFVCNSRYGWGSYNNTNGASQHFHREFIDAIFSEDKFSIGAANQDSKEDTVPFLGNGALRWCLYEINILGDPALDIWTDEPEDIHAEYSDAIIMGFEDYEVSVDGIQGAVVTLSRDNEILAVALTDDQGNATLTLEEVINEPGAIDLTIVAHNYLPLYDEVRAIQPDRGYPWVDEVVVIDPDGNEDGQADAGETIQLSPMVRNLGLEPLEGLRISISSEDQWVTITNSQASYPVIGVESQDIADEPAGLFIDANCQDLREVPITLEMIDSEEHEWTQEVILLIHAPSLAGQFLTVHDEEYNANGKLDPGEEVEVTFALTNQGTGRAQNIVATLDSDNPYIELIETEAQLESLEPNGHTEFDQPFLVRVSEDCPNPYRVVMYVRITGPRDFNRPFLFDMGVGGTSYSFENNEDEWNHLRMGNNYGDQWHLCENDNHTPGGSSCIKVGSVNNDENYANSLNCSMAMPEFSVDGPLLLTFWHKIDAEDNETPGWAYDGGFVEIYPGFGWWQTLEPMTLEGEGYPYEIQAGASENPLDNGQGCFSGTHDWEPVMFDLSDYQHQDVEIRFHFGSDGSENGGGWWIDDIELRMPGEISSPTDLNGETLDEGVLLNWQTPVVGRDDMAQPTILLGFHLFRAWDDEFIMLDTLIADNQFFDNLEGIPYGDISYSVSALYTNGESDPSDFFDIEWTAVNGDEASILPTEWAISRIYPNPFNSATRIGYDVPESGFVSLAVFDMQGRQVRQLASGDRAPGRYQAVFDAAVLPSGVYLVRLHADSHSLATRLILVR